MDPTPCVLEQSTSCCFIEKVPQHWRSILPCIHDNGSRMESEHCQAGIPHFSYSCYKHASDLICPPQTSDSPTSFLTLWLTILPSISQGTLSLSHETISPTHQQVCRSTPSLLFLGLFCLLPIKAGSSTWLKTHLLLPCQGMCTIHRPFFF